MAIQNATNVSIRVGGTTAGNTIGFATSASLSVSMDLRDSTNKQSLRWQENLGGLKSFELSGDAFVDFSASVTGNDYFENGNTSEGNTLKSLPSLYTTWEAGTEVDVVFGNSGKNYTGKGIITSISIDAGVEENATYSISITGTGALSQSA